MPPPPDTIASLARALASRTVTSAEITERCLSRIGESSALLNAFIVVYADDARRQARAADEEIGAGRHRGPLHGVPISLKDLIDVRGSATTAASRVRQAHVATQDALVVKRLREAGAVIVGKTNLHEFALGTTSEDSAYGPVRHPLDPNRSAGGSSGGSAVSVATGMAYGSIGTDTGGSVRIPAAACGLVGLKPTLDEVPTAGVVPLSRTLDHVGPLCRTVEDAAILFDALCGAGERPWEPRAGVRGLRIGVLRDYFMALLDPQVAQAFARVCTTLTGAGARLEDVRLRYARDIAPIYLHIVLSEAAAFHAKTLESRADDYTPPVRLRLEMGRYLLAEDYMRALRGRDMLRREVDAALGAHDVLLLPSVAVPATKIGAATVRVGGQEESVRTITLRLTQLFNITGHPAVSLPCGATAEGLPVGAQLVGARHTTRTLLQTAAAVVPYLGPGTSP